MIKKILYCIAGILLVTLFFLIFDYIRFADQQDQFILDTGFTNSIALRNEVNTVLQKVMDEGHRIAEIMEKTDFSKSELEALIKKSAYGIEEILGVTVGYQPYAFDPSIELYCPYFDKNKNSLIYIEDVYDYTNDSLATAQWYTGIVKNNGSAWVEPYFAQGAQTLVADYGIPFYYKEGPNRGKIQGTVTMTISLQRLQDLIHKLSLGKTGYGFVCSNKGVLLAHPRAEFIGYKNVTALISEESNVDMQHAYRSLLNGESGNIKYKGEKRKEDKLFFFDQVPSSSWGIGVVFFKNDMLTSGAAIKRKNISLFLVISLLVLTLLTAYLNGDYFSEREIWYLSWATSIVLVGNILFVWYLQHTLPDVIDKETSPPIITLASVKSVINNENQKATQKKRPQPRIVPTGIYIERLEFEDAYNLNISGVLWQRYDTIMLKKCTPGFKFPRISPYAESQYIEESSREIIGGDVLIHYNFRTTLLLNFDYQDYPFDKRNIDINIAPLNYRDNLLFTPDLGSYDYTTPSKKSAIDPNIHLPGNQILESYFNYMSTSHNTDFGVHGYDYFDKVSTLHYHIKIKRILITSFITYLIPVFVTLIMLIILIRATAKSREENSSGAIVLGMASFFFVLIYSHIDLRKNIETSDFMYIEYFYLMAYTMVILSTYNLITYTRMPNAFFDYKNNLIVKAIFWPLFLLMVLCVTLMEFYY